MEGSHGFSGFKGEGGGGDQSSPTEFKGRTIENCQVTVDEGGGEREGDFRALQRMRHISS